MVFTKPDGQQDKNPLCSLSFVPIHKKWPFWPLIGWDIFKFSPATAELILNNRERASTYECPLPSLCFAVQCNKDGRYVLWFADIFSSPLQLLNGFRKNIIGSKYTSQCPLPFVFSGQSVNKEGKWYSTYSHNIKLFGLCFTTLIQSIL